MCIYGLLVLLTLLERPYFPPAIDVDGQDAATESTDEEQACEWPINISLSDLTTYPSAVPRHLVRRQQPAEVQVDTGDYEDEEEECLYPEEEYDEEKLSDEEEDDTLVDAENLFDEVSALTCSHDHSLAVVLTRYFSTMISAVGRDQEALTTR